MLASSPSKRDVLLRRATTTISASAASTSSASSAQSSCSSNSNSSFCEKPVGSPTLPIALGVAIPLTFAIIVLFVLHRRHVRRLKKEDLVAAQIDLNHDDFDMTPPRSVPRSGREKIYGNDYLLPIGNDLSQSRVSLNSPYDVIPQEVSRLHGNRSYTALPRAPESAKLRRNTTYYQQDSPFDFRNQFKSDNASAKSPSRLSTMTSSTLDVNAARNLPKLSMVEESFEMQEMSKPQSALVDTPSSDASASSDPIVKAVYNGFHELPQDASSASDPSSSPPGLSLSPPESIHSLSPSPFPTRSDSVKRLSQRYPRRLSTAPPVPSRESKLPPEDRVSYYVDPSSSESGTDNESDSGSVENYQETLQPSTLQSPANSDELMNTTVPHAFNFAPPQDSISQENTLRRQRSLSSPADAAERASRLRSFYKDYFDKPMPNGHEPALPVLTQDDSAVAYDSAESVPAPRVAPSPNIASSQAAAAGRTLRPGPAPRHPIGLYDHFEGEVPRSLSSQSGRPFEEEVQYGREPRPYFAYNSGYYTPQYQPQYHPYMPQTQPMPQRAQPKRLPPLEPLSPLPTPHQLREERILGSPTLFAPPRRPRAGTAGSSVGSSGGSPTTPQQQWTEMQLRTLPTPYMLRNSASYSGLEFLPPKKYSPSGGTIPGSHVDNVYQYGYNNQHIVDNRLTQQLPRELVPVGRDGVDYNLRPQWSMRE
ncbi:uncharacterized protein V1513DRAFT_439963 [Lipomyces chichibuensis]|uniref:uncharacterized protein n=1 Tax=Lipomyces chichibuensis TaxID=1546026 RepID=UPI0033441BDF